MLRELKSILTISYLDGRSQVELFSIAAKEVPRGVKADEVEGVFRTDYHFLKSKNKTCV